MTDVISLELSSTQNKQLFRAALSYSTVCNSFLKYLTENKYCNWISQESFAKLSMRSY